jgi:hypothetical protein
VVIAGVSNLTTAHRKKKCVPSPFFAKKCSKVKGSAGDRGQNEGCVLGQVNTLPSARLVRSLSHSQLATQTQPRGRSDPQSGSERPRG